MLILNNTLCRLCTNLLHKAKCSSAAVDKFMDLKSPQISMEDRKKVLNILNDSSNEELSSKISISQVRLKSLEKWKTKNGPFRTLDEVLEVDGLSEKVLDKLCKNIIDDWDSTKHKKPKKAPSLRIKQLLTPNLPDDIGDALGSAVGIHLCTTGISWAKMHRDEKLISQWGYEVFNTLPKKSLLTETFYLAREILAKIPEGDAYIFEGSSALNPQGQTQMATVMSYVQNLGLTAMLFSLLNTSQRHNPSGDNRVFQLRSKVPARLFGTLVGGERVAANTRISQLIYPESETFSLPCTKVAIEESQKMSFGAQNPANKELLSQSLMLIIAFMDLCIYNNPASYQALIPGNRSSTLKKIGENA